MQMSVAMSAGSWTGISVSSVRADESSLRRLAVCPDAGDCPWAGGDLVVAFRRVGGQFGVSGFRFPPADRVAHVRASHGSGCRRRERKIGTPAGGRDQEASELLAVGRA